MPPISTSTTATNRWVALWVLCSGVLMIVLDSTIVNVALPAIQADLGFDQTSLVWVVNSYLLTFGGCLLLGGRLGDLYGHRRLFLIGLVAFTLASLVCGLATSGGMLIAARALQGIGGAVVDAVAMSLVMTMFQEEGERAKAMGIFGFVASAGGSIGVLLGGALTSFLSWHWIFLVNVPVGLLVYALTRRLVPADGDLHAPERLDVGGAVTITAALMTAVYGVVNGNDAGWLSLTTLGTLGLAAVLLAVFAVIETRVAEPLMPLWHFANRNITIANLIAVLWAASMFAWFFLSTLYMSRVLGYGPMAVALAFLPADVIMGILSVGISARLVMWLGVRPPLVAGLALGAIGLALFARAPVDGTFVLDILPGMLLLGVGAGIAFNPLLLVAMSHADPSEEGLASGLVNTSFMMGGALGLAILASIAAAATHAAAADGTNGALAAGYGMAFGIGAAGAALAAMLALMLSAREKERGAEVA